jgi:hypothetical protein
MDEHLGQADRAQRASCLRRAEIHIFENGFWLTFYAAKASQKMSGMFVLLM